MQLALTKKDHRLQFRFWLDVVRPEEKALAEYVEELKERRRFAQSIRDALCLLRDLQAGRITVLLALFPWIEDYFRERFANTRPAADQEWFIHQVEQIKGLLQQRETLPLAPAHTPLPSRDSNPLLADTLEIKSSPSKNNQSGRILTLQVWLTADIKNIRLFKPEDLELVTGHPAFNQEIIRAEIARRKKADTTAPATPIPPSSTGKKLKGADLVFAAPSFEDMELL
jgi:hypothetical protein